MIPQYDVALADFREGIAAWPIWGRLGWQEIKRRYRRTTIGPFWSTASLGLFVFSLGLVWAHLWGQDPKTYLPFLCAGMLAWNLISSIITDGCIAFIGGESFIKGFRFPFTLLSCATVWRNLIVFFHNLIIFLIVGLYAGMPVRPASLLVVPALAVLCLNGVWIATLMAVVCSRYRDLQQLIASFLQIALFVTPIFFTPEQLGPRFRRVTDFNVLFHFVDVLRAPLLGRAPAAWSWFIVALATIGGWTLTVWVYSRFRRRVPYWL